MDQIEKQNKVHSIVDRSFVQVTTFEYEVILTLYGPQGGLLGTIKLNRENLVLAVDHE